MADPLISLETDRVSVQPGGQARVGVTVTNPGTQVEGYWLQVLGPSGAWAEVVPPEVSVYPQEEASATVVFSPPSGAEAPGGVHPFGVIARSTLDAQASAAAEGDVEVGEVHGLQAKIIPVTSAGRWRGRHVIKLSNWGNAPAQLRMTAANPDDALGFYLSPELVYLPPRAEATVRLTARARHPFLRGSPVRLPFQVVGEPVDAAPGPPPPGPGYGDPSRPVVDAALNQKAILSAGVITLLALLVAGIIALVAFMLLRPPSAAETLASRGSPPKPQFRVVSTGPDNVVLAWDRVELAERYNLQYVDPTTDNVNKVEALDGALTGKTVGELKPETAHCFRLSVTRGGLTGPASDKICATTTAPVPTPTPPATPTPPPPATSTEEPASSPPPSETVSTPPTTTTPSPIPGDPNTDPLMKQQWIAVTEILPKSGGSDEADAVARAQELTNVGLEGKVLDTRFYPRLQVIPPTPATPAPIPEESFLVYIGPVPNQVDAQAKCAEVLALTGGTSCAPAQPDPLQ